MPLRRIRQLFLTEAVSVSRREKIAASLVAMAGLVMVALISQAVVGETGTPFIAAYMGAAAVLVFAAPHSPFSQPWPLLGGHIISAFVGVACYNYIPDTVVAAAFAVALSILVMHSLHCLHPPGGAAAMVAVVGGPAIHQLGYGYALVPVGLNALVILGAALLFNNLVPGRRYPAAPAMKAPAASAWALGQPRFGDADLEAALAEMDAYIDVSREDLQKIYGRALLIANKRRMGAVHCADVMTRDVVAVAPQTPLKEARRQLRQRGIKGAPVVDVGQQVLGMLTLADLMRHADAPDSARVDDVMSAPAVTAGEFDHIVDLVPLFTEHGIHHLPIIDAQQRLVGLVTRSDLMRALLLVRT